MTKTSIIDSILGTSPNNKNFTVSDMLTENNAHGFISKLRVRPYLVEVGKISPYHLTQLSATFNYIKDGVKISNLIHEEEEAGNRLCWLRFKPGTTPIPVKVYLTEGLIEFFKAYQKELITPTFNLEELLQEAEK